MWLSVRLKVILQSKIFRMKRSLPTSFLKQSFYSLTASCRTVSHLNCHVNLDGGMRSSMTNLTQSLTFVWRSWVGGCWSAKLYLCNNSWSRFDKIQLRFPGSLVFFTPPQHDLSVIFSMAGNLHRVQDMYTRDRSTPRPDSFYGGSDDITGSAGSQVNGFTTIVFRKKIRGESKYCQRNKIVDLR